ncbi:MAG TPA: hypothetical protein PLD20_28335 [Blastocatellia bacterium]|nr:hypothetical protein [Blastocatellia bacterium]HMV84562.1 hypothetical protein [Blastocatellia bacterium]HMX27846.1 hypothetical protein [Blastocatellia bacterium]HMY73338.1 hypothetical protein [Blastocatellia bacterium]HMZ21874.1 hypothetical protein [Blastocatellia bacterium]
MNSATLPGFWTAYDVLDESVKRRARKAYRLWSQNPFHPSLHFKCINQKENIWSVRVTDGYRAIGLLKRDTVTWFWIGNHDDYEQFFS